MQEHATFENFKDFFILDWKSAVIVLCFSCCFYFRFFHRLEVAVSSRPTSNVESVALNTRCQWIVLLSISSANDWRIQILTRNTLHETYSLKTKPFVCYVDMKSTQSIIDLEISTEEIVRIFPPSGSNGVVFLRGLTCPVCANIFTPKFISMTYVNVPICNSIILIVCSLWAKQKCKWMRQKMIFNRRFQLREKSIQTENDYAITRCQWHRLCVTAEWERGRETEAETKVIFAECIQCDLCKQKCE